MTKFPKIHFLRSTCKVDSHLPFYGVVSKASEFFSGVFLFHMLVSFIRANSLCQVKVSCFVDFLFFGSVTLGHEDF